MTIIKPADKPVIRATAFDARIAEADARIATAQARQRTVGGVCIAAVLMTATVAYQVRAIQADRNAAIVATSGVRAAELRADVTADLADRLTAYGRGARE